MNELKPEDVMRALKICDDKTQTCEGCPYIDHCSDINKDVLALLREKDARIEHLEKTMKDSILSNTELLKNLNRLVEEKDAEIERLKKLHEGFATKFKAEFKADAISEFVDRLKERMREVYPADIYDSDIDEIAKEIKGELDEN